MKRGEVVMYGVLEERSKCCEASVAAARAALEIRFEMIKEGKNQLRVHILQCELLRFSAADAAFRKDKYKPERVSVSCDGAGAEAPVLLKMVDEEALQER